MSIDTGTLSFLEKEAFNFFLFFLSLLFLKNKNDGCLKAV